MSLDRLLGRYGDRAGLPPAESQPVREEVTDLAETPADAGLLFDPGSGLPGRAGRMLQEESLQGVLMLDEGASGLMPAAAAQTRQAALDGLVEVALECAS